MNKKEIAQVLEEIAFLLEFQGENPFKVRAYRNGARALLNLDEDLDKVIKEGRLTEIEGIGEHLAKKITELAKKGRLSYYEKLRRSMPKGLLEMIQVQGLGPKKVKALYKQLKISSVEKLKKAAGLGKIAKLKGFGARTEKNSLEAINAKEKYSKRHLWRSAMEMAIPILEGLKKVKGVKKAEIAGSLRRKMETVGDLDFLVAATDPKPVSDWFIAQGTKTITKGETKSSIKLEEGIQADLRVVAEKEFPFALAYLTGRLLLRREAYAVNVSKVIDACIANKKIIELNGNPERLDMDWRAASEKELLSCINTDAHAAEHLNFITAGVNIARKRWLEKKRVINTRTLAEIVKLFAS